MRSEEIDGDEICTFGIGHATTLETKSRKKKHPLGFAPPKEKNASKKVQRQITGSTAKATKRKNSIQ